MTFNEPNDRLEGYFAGVTEHTFQTQLGVADPLMVDYLTNLLIRFVRPEYTHRVRSVTGKPLLEIGEMVEEAKKRIGDAQQELHRYIGDFALFWAGVYPEALRRKSRHGAHDQYFDYCAHGKRSYQIASQIDSTDDEAPEAEVLERLSERFELCAYGLREVRREWEKRDEESSGGGLLLN